MPSGRPPLVAAAWNTRRQAARTAGAGSSIRSSPPAAVILDTRVLTPISTLRDRVRLRLAPVG
jgi:hypothetical protein